MASFSVLHTKSFLLRVLGEHWSNVVPVFYIQAAYNDTEAHGNYTHKQPGSKKLILGPHHHSGVIPEGPMVWQILLINLQMSLELRPS